MSSGPRRAATAATQNDGIAHAYQRSKQSPTRRYVEGYTFFRMLGDLCGQSVLDLACGEGIYSRQLRVRGARRVVGVDISPVMIGLARKQEADAPEAEYQVGDAQNQPNLGLFDIVCAAYLLHYAHDVGELGRMSLSIARQLKPGGRFIAINENPDQPENGYAGYLRYRFSKRVAAPRCEESPVTYEMISGRELFRFEACHFERGTYERLLAAAGFVDVRWQPVELDPSGLQVMDAEYWAEYLDKPPVIGLSCTLSDRGEVRQDG